MTNVATRYWLISHTADTTETGSPMERTYVKTIWRGGQAVRFAEKEILQDWCRAKFGAEVAWVQGVAPVRSWTVRESTIDAFELAEPIIWGGVETKTSKLVLGIGNRSGVRVESDAEIARNEWISANILRNVWSNAVLLR